LDAFADIRKPKEDLTSVPGSPPDLISPPSGCRFHPRCPFAQAKCSAEEPRKENVSATHMVACHFWKEIAEKRGTFS
jgi:oligopeptide/dipeptide ABC transporter ATP-binding protein